MLMLLCLFVFAVVGLPTKETTDLYDTFLLLHNPNLQEKKDVLKDVNGMVLF